MTTDTARLIIVASVRRYEPARRHHVPEALRSAGLGKWHHRCVHCADRDGIDVEDADLQRRFGERNGQRKADAAAAADDTDVQALRHRADMLPAERRAPLDLRRPP